MINSGEGRNKLKQIWQRILRTLEKSQPNVSFSTGILTAAATSFSFRLDENTNPADERYLLYNSVAYLTVVLDEEIYNKYIPLELS